MSYPLAAKYNVFSASAADCLAALFPTIRGFHAEPIASCDFTPQWHARSGKLLATGKTFRYKNDEHFRGPPSDAVYSVYGPDRRTWSAWARVNLPDLPQFKTRSAWCTQRYDLPNGDVLLPVYFRLGAITCRTTRSCRRPGTCSDQRTVRRRGANRKCCWIPRSSRLGPSEFAFSATVG